MATIRTHTTLRTLFAATVVFAFLAMTWTAFPDDGLAHVFLTPCAIGFVAGLFGLSFVAALLTALATAVAIAAFFDATVHDGETEWANRAALANVASAAIWFVVPWLTAWWWGLYLRHQWSKPAKVSASSVLVGDDSHEHLTLRERLVARCEGAPIGFFIVSVLANIYVLSIFHWLVSSVRHR
jgi:hypothetical protein